MKPLIIEAIALIKSNKLKSAINSIDVALSKNATQSDYLLLKAEILEASKELQESMKIISSLKESANSPKIEELYARVKKTLEDTEQKRNFYIT